MRREPGEGRRRKLRIQFACWADALCDKRWTRSFPRIYLIPRVKLYLSFVASLSPSCQNFTLGETRRKERDREERLWSYEEDAAIFSKLVPETASEAPELHLPSLPVGSTPTAQCL